MRLLPYTKALVERQRAGNRPWLAVLTLGADPRARPILRRLVADGDADVARPWCPDDVAIETADLTPFIGLDVLLVDGGAGEARVAEMMYALWRRAKPATVWVLKEPDLKLTYLSPNWGKFRAARIVEYPGCRELILDGIGTPIGAGLRERVESVRELAFLCGEPPLFNRPELQPSRVALALRLGLDPQCLAA